MRKAIIELQPNNLVIRMQENIYEYIERIEGKELIRLDFEKRTKLVITDLVLRPGKRLEDIRWPKGVEILNVLRENGSRYTVLLKARAPGSRMAGMFGLFDLNVIYDVPFSATKNHIRFSAIGEGDSLRKLIKVTGILGKVEKVSFTKASFTDHDLLGVLTDKQKEIIIEAKKKGYYNYPRKINTADLSETLGISKATTVEHLRKAEMRLMNSLLEGY